MRYRRLGRDGPAVSAIGLGAWGMSGDYGPTRDEESIGTIQHALELGVNHIDTADQYGWGHNEELVGQAVAGRRDNVLLATKCGMVRNRDGRVTVSGRPEHIIRAITRSLRRLGTDRVDLYYLHRVDPTTPIEESIGAMADLVRSGKVRWLGVSEASPATIRRAHAVHPLSAVQSEYSLWTREPETDVLPTLREFGIALVPFSPLGRGFLAGQVRRREDLADGDFRAQIPRFKAESLSKNLPLAEALERLAAEKEVEPAQLALAWLLHQGDDIVPIPGMRTEEHVEANIVAPEVTLSPEEIDRLNQAFPLGAAVGDRYPAEMMRLIDR